MNISLTPQLEALVRQQVRRGNYPSNAAVIRAALALMAERDDARKRRKRRLRSQRNEPHVWGALPVDDGVEDWEW